METNVDELIDDLYGDDIVTSLNGENAEGLPADETFPSGYSTVSDNALLQSNLVTNYLLGCNIYIMLLLLGLGVCAFFYKVIFDGIFKIL